LSIIERIVNILDEKSIKAAELCKYIGINTSTMTNWKNRNTDPPARYIIPICDFLKVSCDYLLTGGTSKNLKQLNSNITEDENDLLTYFRALSRREQRILLVELEAKLNQSSVAADEKDEDKRGKSLA